LPPSASPITPAVVGDVVLADPSGNRVGHAGKAYLMARNAALGWSGDASLARPALTRLRTELGGSVVSIEHVEPALNKLEDLRDRPQSIVGLKNEAHRITFGPAGVTIQPVSSSLSCGRHSLAERLRASPAPPKRRPPSCGAAAGARENARHRLSIPRGRSPQNDDPSRRPRVASIGHVRNRPARSRRYRSPR
jgi:hypothetical protein